MYLGIDVGGTKVAAALVDEEGKLTQKTVQFVDQSTNTSAAEQLMHLMEHFSSTSSLQGVGVAVPGIADSERRTVWAPNVRGWEHLSLWDRLEREASCPISIESDRNSALLGECLYGKARGLQDVVFLILGTGIGAGILSGGRLIRGASEIGGAVGWLPVLFRGRLRHFEQVASGPGIESIAREDLNMGSLPELGARACQGDVEVLRLFAEVGEVIGQALSVLVSALNPQLIVVGGGVSNVWDHLSSTGISAMHRWSQPVAVTEVSVQVSELGEDGGILGAAAVSRFENEGRLA